MDGIFHVCRAFEDADVVHVEDRVDPVEDLEIIHKFAACSHAERAMQRCGAPSTKPCQLQRVTCACACQAKRAYTCSGTDAMPDAIDGWAQHVAWSR